MSLAYDSGRLRMGLICIASVAVLLFAYTTQPTVGLSGWVERRTEKGAAGISASFAPSGEAGAQAGASVPLYMYGDVGFNIQSALDASSGALRDITIRPGETWSFNATIGDPSHVQVRTVGGIAGGGWCDLASRYVQAVRTILPFNQVAFLNHVTSSGVRLESVADADAVSIWNIDGRSGNEGSRQDLLITNTLPQAIRLQVLDGPGPSQVFVRASLITP